MNARHELAEQHRLVANGGRGVGRCDSHSEKKKNAESGYHRSRGRAAFTLVERELDRQGLRGGERGLYAR